VSNQLHDTESLTCDTDDPSSTDCLLGMVWAAVGSPDGVPAPVAAAAVADAAFV